MDSTTSIRWATAYTVLSVAVTILSLAIIGLGVALGGLAAIGLQGLTPPGLSLVNVPVLGIGVILLGGIIWWFMMAAITFKTIVTAVENEIADRWNTETVKSEILSVLNAQLSEMHDELVHTQEAIETVPFKNSSTDFEFPEN